MNILVTQSKSFLGKNLIENLKNIRDGNNRTRPQISISTIFEDNGDKPDFVFVLPGERDDSSISKWAEEGFKIVYISQLAGNKEEELFLNKDNCFVFRYPTIVGKWQGEESDIARLCKSVVNDESVILDKPNKTTELLFVDGFINGMLNALEGKVNRCEFPDLGEQSFDPTAPYDGITPVEKAEGSYCYSKNTIKTTYGNILEHLISFNDMDKSKIIPEMSTGKLAQKLFAMYLSYLPENKMCYTLNMNVDNRGIFTELFKTRNNGQVSINIARPNNTRGQHWHNSKWEIFVVVSGHGLIEEREIGGNKVHSFEVREEEMKAIIMLPRYTHSITNLENDKDLVTVMFANEEFDAKHPDTFLKLCKEDGI